ncbi:MAG: glycine--tRNA ligase, partial [Minisyncoccia bacterium]
GKAFRNEINPGNFTYRMREFEQMEMQFFVHPSEADKWFEYWVQQRLNWYISLGIKKENLRLHQQTKEELAHYARAAVDIEYKFPFGWKEIEGIHNRGDWDLSNHSKYSGHELVYYDEKSKEKFIPYIIETSAGADRSALVFLIDAYEEIVGGRTQTTEATKEVEVVLKFHPFIAPVKVAIFPLLKNKENLTTLAKEIYKKLKLHFIVQYDEVDSIGRRYRRQDEIGTPFCVTVDFQSLEDQTVTVRDRDTLAQERVKIDNLINYLKEKIETF